jgi:hypothetical protein
MKSRTRAIFPYGLLLLLTLSNSGCNFNNGALSNAATQSQALEVTASVFAALADAPIAQGASPQAVLKNIAPYIRSASLGEIAVVPAVFAPLRPMQTTPTTIPTYTYACPGGGTIVVTGSYTGNFTSKPPSENIVETTVETVTNCNGNGVVFNGSPSIDITNTVTLNGSVYEDVSTITGGYTVGSTTCAMNLSITASVSSTTNLVNGSIAGTACGATIAGAITNSTL